MRWQDVAVARPRLGRVELLNRGGLSRVYRIPDFDLPGVAAPLVYKEYNAELGDVAGPGLARIIELRRTLPADQRLWFDTHLAWPLRIVVDGEDTSGRATVAGVVMRLIPDAYFQVFSSPAGPGERRPSEARLLFLGRAEVRARGLSFPDMAQRRWLGVRLAYLLAFLHNRGIVFGDISPRNVLFRLRPTPDVLFVDCDAVRRVGSAAVVAQGHTPGWFPPEALREPQSISSDLYKLGLFIVRILAPGQVVTPDNIAASLYGVFDETGIGLARASLGADPAARPTARVWYRYLRFGLGSQPRNQPSATPHRRP